MMKDNNQYLLYSLVILLLVLLVPNNVIGTIGTETYNFATGNDSFYKYSGNGYLNSGLRPYTTLTMTDSGAGYAWFCKDLVYNYNGTVNITSEHLGSLSSGNMGLVLANTNSIITNLFENFGFRWGLQNNTVAANIGSFVTSGAFFSYEAGYIHPQKMRNYTINMQLDLENNKINYVNRTYEGAERNIFNITPIYTEDILNRICYFGIANAGVGYIDLDYITITGDIQPKYIGYKYYYINNLSPVLEEVNLTVSSSTGEISYTNTTGVNYDYMPGKNTYNSNILNLIANNKEHTVKYIVLKQAINYSLYFDTNTESKVFRLINNLGANIQGAEVSFYTTVNGTKILVTEGLTDFSGTFEIFLNPERNYEIVATHTNYNTWYGNITPIFTDYTVNIQQAGEGFLTSLYDETYYSIKSREKNIQFQTNLSVTNNNGNLVYYGAYTTYNGTYYKVNLSGPSSNTASLNVSPLKSSIENTINITYFIKIYGYDEAVWNNYYYLSNNTAANQSLLFGLFRIDDDEVQDGYKVIVGMIIILAFMFVTAVFTGNSTATTFTGIIALTIVTFKGLFPFEAAITGGVLLVLLLIIDFKNNVG